MGKSMKMEIAIVSAIGSAGGLMCMWKGGTMVVSRIVKKERELILWEKIQWLEGTCILVNIYAPNLAVERSLF